MDLGARIKVYQRAVDIWGIKAQLEMAQEEATEMALAVRKHIRKQDLKSLELLFGEIADVEIMIEQLEMIFSENDIRSRIDAIKSFKVARLSDRLDNKTFE